MGEFLLLAEQQLLGEEVQVARRLDLGPGGGLFGDVGSVVPVAHIEEIVPVQTGQGGRLPQVLGAVGVDEGSDDGGCADGHGQHGRAHGSLPSPRARARCGSRARRWPTPRSVRRSPPGGCGRTARREVVRRRTRSPRPTVLTRGSARRRRAGTGGGRSRSRDRDRSSGRRRSAYGLTPRPRRVTMVTSPITATTAPWATARTTRSLRLHPSEARVSSTPTIAAACGQGRGPGRGRQSGERAAIQRALASALEPLVDRPGDVVAEVEGDLERGHAWSGPRVQSRVTSSSSRTAMTEPSISPSPLPQPLASSSAKAGVVDERRCGVDALEAEAGLRGISAADMPILMTVWSSTVPREAVSAGRRT